MSILVLLVPPRARLRAGLEPTPAPVEWRYVLSNDGRSAARQGSAAPSLLPRASSVVAVLADADVGWHRITLPRAPAKRLRAALMGVLEDALLEDADMMHFALAPDARAGEPAWVAVVHRPWLQAQLATLEAAGLTVERVLPAAAPGSDDAAFGHFNLAEAHGDGDAALRLVHGDGNGITPLGAHGTLARSLVARWSEQAPLRWSASPAASSAAEAWLGAPVAALTDEERALAATASRWNLRQFELAPRRRGVRALRDSWQRFLQPQWRPVRYGLLALVALQLVGMNLWAWQQRRAIVEREQAMVELLRQAHPQVRAVLDAPLQMRRETEVLRAAAGKPGDEDLEALLGRAAAAWPPGAAPAASLRFEPGRLSIAAADWTPPQIEQFRQQLRAAGWAVEVSGGVLTISRAAAPGGRA